MARLLGLPFPGGPPIDRSGPRRRPGRNRLPPRHDRPARCAFAFSFSGLKTAVARWVEARERAVRACRWPMSRRASRRRWSTSLPPRQFARPRRHGVGHLLLGGGVAANSRLRALAAERCDAAGLRLRVPRPGLCTDNGAMVAALGAQLVAHGAHAVATRSAGRFRAADHARCSCEHADVGGAGGRRPARRTRRLRARPRRPAAQVYRSSGAEPRVVVIDPTGRGIADVPPDLLAVPRIAGNSSLCRAIRRRLQPFAAEECHQA